MNRRITKEIMDRKKLYVEDRGLRSQAWKEKKKATEKLIRERKAGFMATQKEHLLSDKANRIFLKHVRNFSSAKKPKMFDVKDLLPGRTDIEAAEILGEYFNKVSCEFDPLDLDVDIPAARSVGIRVLERFEVAARIKKFRKPNSMVPGDVFPKLMTAFLTSLRSH